MDAPWAAQFEAPEAPRVKSYTRIKEKCDVPLDWPLGKHTMLRFAPSTLDFDSGHKMKKVKATTHWWRTINGQQGEWMPTVSEFTVNELPYVIEGFQKILNRLKGTLL